MHSSRLPPPRLGPGRRGPGRFWASRRYEQVIDRVDERCQIGARAVTILPSFMSRSGLVVFSVFEDNGRSVIRCGSIRIAT
jgi:hypothetical protein